jgi:non-ribosomal peptide synthase protein (TIGR01720 family)
LYRRSSIEKLTERYLSSLRALIEHCMSRDEARFTPSDFSLAKLDQSTLDKVVTKIDRS